MFSRKRSSRAGGPVANKTGTWLDQRQAGGPPPLISPTAGRSESGNTSFGSYPKNTNASAVSRTGAWQPNEDSRMAGYDAAPSAQIGSESSRGNRMDIIASSRDPSQSNVIGRDLSQMENKLPALPPGANKLPALPPRANSVSPPSTTSMLPPGAAPPRQPRPAGSNLVIYQSPLVVNSPVKKSVSPSDVEAKAQRPERLDDARLFPSTDGVSSRNHPSEFAIAGPSRPRQPPSLMSPVSDHHDFSWDSNDQEDLVFTDSQEKDYIDKSAFAPPTLLEPGHHIPPPLRSDPQPPALVAPGQHLLPESSGAASYQDEICEPPALIPPGHHGGSVAGLGPPPLIAPGPRHAFGPTGSHLVMDGRTATGTSSSVLNSLGQGSLSFEKGPPSIPQLPASPSLDMAFFSGNPREPEDSGSMHSPQSPTSNILSAYFSPITLDEGGEEGKTSSNSKLPTRSDTPVSLPKSNGTVAHSDQARYDMPSDTRAKTEIRPHPFTSAPGRRGLPSSQSMATGLQFAELNMAPEVRMPTPRSVSNPDGATANAMGGHSRRRSASKRPILQVIASSDNIFPTQPDQALEPKSRSANTKDLLKGLPSLQTNLRSVSPRLPSPHGPPPAYEQSEGGTRPIHLKSEKEAIKDMLSPASLQQSALPRRSTSRAASPQAHLLPPPAPASSGRSPSPTQQSVVDILAGMGISPPPPDRKGSPRLPSVGVLDRPKPTSRAAAYRDTTMVSNVQQSGLRARGTRKETIIRKRTRSVCFLDILIEESIQEAFFSQLSSPSLLALLGAIPSAVRAFVKGETVGKWVCDQWGIRLDGNELWPGLGVWEGFLESLQHDPEAYPSYPPKLQHLLEHLCLSHTLVVMFLRSLPQQAFPNTAPFPFEDETSLMTSGLPRSVSSLSIARRPSATVETGSTLARMPIMPRAERVVELVMPAPLSAPGMSEPTETLSIINPTTSRSHGRRNSVGSASIMSGWTRHGKTSSTSDSGSVFRDNVGSGAANINGLGKGSLPPVSFPSAKRYHFTGYGDPTKKTRSRTKSENGSIWSSADESFVQGSRRHFAGPDPSTMPRFIAGMMSHASSTTDLHGRQSPTTSSHLKGALNPDRTNNNSPSNASSGQGRSGDRLLDKPVPYVVGRAPILRIFLPLSDAVPKWPSAQAAYRVRQELERCGAWGKLRVGDIIINTALQEPLIPRHLMMFVPNMQPFLVPLEFRASSQGHLPSYLDAFTIPPSYHYPLLPSPQIIYLDLDTWADQAFATLRLTFERRDVTTSRGDKIAAKRYLHVAGFEIGAFNRRHAVEDWQGMITLEADGTAEGKEQLLLRLGRQGPMEARVQSVRGPWEVVRERSLRGTVWLRMVPETG